MVDSGELVCSRWCSNARLTYGLRLLEMYTWTLFSGSEMASAEMRRVNVSEDRHGGEMRSGLRGRPSRMMEAMRGRLFIC